MLNILNNICAGKGKDGDVELLEELSEFVMDASLCALGGTAPNPVLTSIKYFRDEYDAHIKEDHCPAGVCKELIRYYIQPEECQACGICLRECPTKAIYGDKNVIHVIDQKKCIRCNTCLDVCPERFSAVVKIPRRSLPLPVPPDTKVIRKR
jgi:NADH-quinone oxidoreductase subunit F